MTLHTTMPLEVVLQGLNEETEALHEISVGHIKMQIVPIAPGVGKIVRLLDCTLDDYLRPEFTPGAMIQYSLH